MPCADDGREVQPTLLYLVPPVSVLYLETVTPHAFLVLFDKFPAVFLRRVGIALEEAVVP